MLKNNCILFVIAAILFSSCEKLSVFEEKEITLSLAGDMIDVYYTPITKSDSDYMVFITNVYVFDESKMVYVPFASGAFTNQSTTYSVNNMKINLETGKKYKFCSSYVGAEVDRYGSVLSFLGFKYGDKPRDLFTGGYFVSLSRFTQHPVCERFYCEKEVLITKNTNEIVLEMKRCASKLSISSDELSHGKIRVIVHFMKPGDMTDEVHPELVLEISPEQKQSEGIVTLTDAEKSWNNDSYSESYRTDFIFINGGTETTFATKELAFYRNTITNVNISFGHSESKPKLIASFESSYSNGETETVYLDL